VKHIHMMPRGSDLDSTSVNNLPSRWIEQSLARW
jgi:hypothetical protein